MESAGARGGRVLIGALIVASVGNGLFLPLSLLFFTRVTDVSLVLVGGLISLANVVVLPIPALAGWLADRIGPVPMVVGAQIIQGLAFLLYSIVNGPVGIVLSVTLMAAGVRTYWSTVFTVIADFSDSSPSATSKDTWYAWANMARTAGISVGGLITAFAIAADTDYAYRAIVFGAAACFLTASLTISLCVRVPRSSARVETDGARARGYREMLKDMPFMSFVAVNVIFALTSRMLALGLPVLVLEGLGGPAWLASAVLVANTVTLAALTAPVVNRLSPYRRTRVIVVAAALWAAWCVMLAVLHLVGHFWMTPLLLTATVLFTAAELIHNPVSLALVTELSPATARGRYLATFQYSFVISGMIAPAYFTSLFQLQHGLPWLILATMNLLTIPIVKLLERTPRAAFS